VLERDAARPVLLTGATGYVGGRLLEALLSRGRRVRCLVRDPNRLDMLGNGDTETVEGDLLDPSSLPAAMAGTGAAYYLVHSMGGRGDFSALDREAAGNFASAARAAGVERIIYLGGLARGDGLSEHLASRQEVGQILRQSGVPSVEFQASIIIGAGSLSFEMIRALVERLPMMVTPRWVKQLAQPIGIDDVIAYLLAALDMELPESQVVEIGGSDRASYGDIMREYARQRGLRRLMIPVPVLTPRLSSYWLGLVTPLYARIGRKLIEGVRNASVVSDGRALTMFPVRPQPLHEQIAGALAQEDDDVAAMRWSPAPEDGAGNVHTPRRRLPCRLVDSHIVRVPHSAGETFGEVCRLGGRRGWLYADWLWRLRGALDRLVGGPGLRRGRRDPERLAVGDLVDFWRVDAVEPERLLRLAAEMKVPGRAWLQFEVDPAPGGARITATAIFDPRGVAGRLYWYAVLPLHRVVFRGMLRGIARALG
jgi:uncharacterized protein YbjT (DUF2867 family)